MMNRFLQRCLPLAAALMLVGTAAPAHAQRGGDEGQQFERAMGVVSDETREGRSVNRQLDQVVNRIVDAVNQQQNGRDFHLQSAKILGGRSRKYDEMINAFALPDGRIYVTLGLMRLIENDPNADDELAFVVGHEVTHVVQHHAQSQAKKAMPANILAVLLGIATRNQTLGGLAQYGAAAYTSHFSREDEYRADKGGLKAMYRAGYDPEAAVSMLRLLERAGGSQNKTINGWFGSHPITENRIDRVQEMIGNLQGDGRLPDNGRADRHRNRRR